MDLIFLYHRERKAIIKELITLEKLDTIFKKFSKKFNFGNNFEINQERTCVSNMFSVTGVEQC